jgi:hypothetical protein
MDIDLIADLREKHETKQLTRIGYVLAACERLQVEPDIVNRQWLANELGLKVKNLTSAISIAKKRGLITK